MRSRHLLPLVALVMSGCTLAPAYHRPAAPVPVMWPTGDAYAKADEATLPALNRAAIFHDPRLLNLMDQALVNNRDLRVAAANIEKARAQYHIQRANLLPEIGASGQVLTNSGSGASSVTPVATANIGVSAYELDLFGRLRSLNSAALNSYFATKAAARATRLTLIGDIATTWLNYGADSSLLDLSQATTSNALQAVKLTRARLEGGVASRSDLSQAQTILATAQADYARQKTALAQDVNALTLLVGAPVDAKLLPGSIEAALNTIGTPPAGLSSQVLLRRPDVMAAEYNLRAANAQIGAARAALFPKVSLSGLFGLASGSLESLFGNAGQAVNQASAAASYSIFSAGAGRANVKSSKAQRDALLATYEKTIQTAFRETADALAREGTIDEQLSANRRGVAASEDAYNIAQARYRGGIDSFLQYLVTQRTLYVAQQGLVATEFTAASNRVTLYRVLGGDELAPENGGNTAGTPANAGN